ncbi:IS1 family transposase [Roseovarius sp. Pro17]|uniref:IS1 family transposase n=1 Tax=Roseovarius sp. Pro17 TaxID=3108175 RepID=UPI002D77A13D|nr:IS1 family transposase [Roseovarius sp. Pro17]
MRKLDTKSRALIIRLLVEGTSIRATSRIADVSKNTVNKLLIDAGAACVKYHDENVRNVKASVIQCDEIWSFTYAKQKDVRTAKDAPESAADTWTWTAIDSDSKLIVSYMVGDRDSGYAIEFMDDLRGRLANRVLLTTDGHKAYMEAVEGAFGGDVDCAQLIKMYGNAPAGNTHEKKYSPAECTGIKKRAVEGNPDQALISASNVERKNLTMRMHMHRFARLTNGFSKKVENHMHAVALHFMYCNFAKVHQTLKVTPAMQAGLTNRLWDIADLVALVDANEPEPKKRGPYKKRQPENLK